jgi:hypothetical protein
MRKLNLLFMALLMSSLSFAQANEDETDVYKKVYEIIITKGGDVKHVVKQGAQISTKIDGKTVNGRWFFKDYPDKVVVVNKKGDAMGVIALNSEKPLRIVTPQPKGGVGVGVGLGPVSVSSMGPGYQSFNMSKYKAEISERMETREEKMRREYAEKEREERIKKELAKQAKKDAKKKKK